MKKSQLYVGIDLSKGPGHDINTEIIMIYNPITGEYIMENIHTWGKEIELPSSEYRVKTEAGNFR